MTLEDEVDCARAAPGVDVARRRDPQPASVDDMARVRADALRAVARLPNPRDIARTLETGEPELAEALYNSFLFHEKNEGKFYRLRVDDAHHAPTLRQMGLVDMRTLFLTSFGIAVTRIIRDGAW